MSQKSRKEKIKILAVIGPTASGKTKLAVNLAKLYNGEIISADSRQVYIGLDLGTGKDLNEYQDVKYHLIDIVKPTEVYNLARFQKDAINAIIDIHNRGKLPVICGGSALYLDSLFSEYQLIGCGANHELREKLKKLSCNELLQMLKENLPHDEAKNKNRLIRRIERKTTEEHPTTSFPFIPEWLIIGILRDKTELHKRIEERLKQRLKDGMIEEVKNLHNQGVSWEKLESFGLEYKYIALLLQGKILEKDFFPTLFTKIKQFAKRQNTWFRKFQKKNIPIYWIKDANQHDSSKLVEDFFNKKKAY